ncbi:unnamed protein product [Heterobilharzia americana]|nr:unnamed protein product [Heterobilharzia americana]
MVLLLVWLGSRLLEGILERYSHYESSSVIMLPVLHEIHLCRKAVMLLDSCDFLKYYRKPIKRFPCWIREGIFLLNTLKGAN